VRRWSIALGGAICAALWVFLSRSTSPDLLKDTDTAVLLKAIQGKSPFSWFLSDWPLYNHFYRPIPTLAFVVDNRLYGTNSAGYALTNDLLAVACVLALFWFLREFLDKPLAAAGGTLLFASWQASSHQPDWTYLAYFAWLTLLVGAIRHGRNWRAYLPAFLVLLYLAHELNPIHPLGSRIIDWLPGRTASCLTFFALIAMAAYARFERLGGSDRKEPITPLTPPATRSTAVATGPRTRWPWAVLAVVATALGFASYEQAVMLPACLLAVAVYFGWLGRRPTWSLQVAFWGLLGCYLLLRHQIIPPGVSQYQNQQLRTTNGALNALEDFVWPFDMWQTTWFMLLQGWFVIFNGALYQTMLSWVSGFVSVWELRREWRLCVAGWGLSVLAFLPMAWLKMFEHYYYWPMALRTVFVIGVAIVAWRLVSIAWCPPEQQAPKRLSPAPGSLPHR
jgi:hypothetical protein